MRAMISTVLSTVIVAEVMPPLAGVCTGDAGVGVGCGFDASRTTAFGLTVVPKKAVLRLPWCAEHCYAQCPPAQPVPEECEDCVYQDAHDRCFRTAYNVQATAMPSQGGCYETAVADDTRAFQKMTEHTESHSSGFIFHHSHSTSTKDFYSFFFEKNFSLALSYKYVIEHAVTLAPSGMFPQPSRELKLAAQLLPARYEGHEAEYRQFVESFGTHYMEQAFMGGSALLTNYFHSCFLHTYSEHDVAQASSSSFIDIFHDNSAKGWGSAINKEMWDSWSNIDLKLNGGNASQYGSLGVNNTMDPADVAQWQATLGGANLVPLTYKLRPITDVLQGGWVDPAVVANVNRSLAAYDAEVGVEMRQLQESLVPKDNYTKPSWCKAPGSSRRRASTSRASPRKAADQPGCPALPPLPPGRSQGAQREPRRVDASAESSAPLAPVPGLLAAAGDLGSLFGRGFDPLQQQPRGPVASWHYDGWACKGEGHERDCDNTWLDPASGILFGRPDEVQLFNSPAAESEGGQQLFVNSSAYKEWHWKQHSTSIGLGVFSYSHSDADAYLSQLLDTRRAVIAVKRRIEVAYQMTLWDTEVLKCEMNPTCAAPPTGGSSGFSGPGTQSNSSFAQQRAALPAACGAGSADAAEFGLFRQAFGTHYVESAIYGGSLQFVLVVNSSLYSKMTETEVMEQTSIGFDLLYVQFAFSHAKAKQTKDVSQIFRENTQVVLLAYGGNSLLLEEGSYSKWAASVPSNPAPINTTFRNVSDLFATTDPRKACMAAEAQAYLASKPPPRYRCGDAAGTQVLDGLPRPESSGVRITRRMLPTLQELSSGAAVAPDRGAAPAPTPSEGQQTMMLTGGAGTCDPASTIPGAAPTDLVGKTFDAKTGEPRLLATPLTCAQGKVWYSPYAGKLLHIPDQLDFVDVSAACDEETMSTITNDTSAWSMSAEAWGFYIGLGIPIADLTIKVGVGFEKQVREIAERLSNYSQTLSTLKRDMSMYRLTFGASGGTPLALGGELQLALENLPTIDGGYASGTPTQCAKYDAFVRAFGTHYVAGASFGAHCEFSTALNKSYASTQTSTFVEEQISISLGIQMKGIGVNVDLGYDTIHSVMKQDAEFRQFAESSHSCSGGDLTLLDKDPPQYDAWAQSVYEAPSWINGSTNLRPISDLLVGVNAANKRGCLKDAVLSYMGTPAKQAVVAAGDGAPPSGTCTSALDCGASHCYDCSCTNGQCTCADGWSGAHCEVPFCLNRTTGCSGHGDCQQTLRNISCTCDAGFTGGHCETATCALKCVHGGTPNADCTICTGCLGAWKGKLCDQWDDEVPHAKLMSKLYAISNASQKMLDAQAQFHPVCKQGHECVGWGVNGVTGAPTAFPIVALTYDPSRTDKKFNNMSEPLEVESNHVVSPVWASTDGANAFPRIEDFVQHVDTVYAGASPVPKGTNGVYSSGYGAAFKTYFQKPDDRALSVVRAAKSYISMSLPIDPTTHTRQYQFDRHAHDFVQSLPPMYDSVEHKQQFKYFLEQYGTSFATSATLGGLVEQYSSWKTWITDERLGSFTHDMLTKNAQIDFGATTGLPGPSGAHDAGYSKVTRTLEPLQCLGGDAATSCDADFSNWAATIPEAPVLLDYELAPISDLVTDPTVKASLETAVKAYVQEQRAEWAAANKCPPTCGMKGAGSCNATTGSSSCRCAYKGLAGRMCTGCAPMSVTATFTDIDGHDRSNTATIACDGKDHTVWTGNTTCRSMLQSCPLPSEARCGRIANGNLVAHAHTSKCFPPPQKDDDDNDNSGLKPARGAGNSRADRQLSNHGCGDFDGVSSPDATKVITGSAEIETKAEGDITCIPKSGGGAMSTSSRRRKCTVKVKCSFS